MNTSFTDSESTNSRDRSGSRSSHDGSQRCRHSSAGSQESVSIEWILLCEFDEYDRADHFLKCEMPRNATRSSRQPLCKFYDKLIVSKHKMVEQIRICYCGDVCPVKYRFRKFVTCERAEISQANDIHIEGNAETQKSTRGIDERVKKIIEEHYSENIRSIRPIDIFTWLNLDKTRENLMKNLPQPKLHQIQYFVNKLRSKTSSSSDDLLSIKELMNLWSFENARMRRRFSSVWTRTRKTK